MPGLHTVEGKFWSPREERRPATGYNMDECKRGKPAPARGLSDSVHVHVKCSEEGSPRRLGGAAWLPGERGLGSDF